MIVGDFNYPRIDWETEHVDESSNIVKPFLDEIQTNFLYQHIAKPTQYRFGQEPSLLDLILTNEEGMINNITHNALLGESDHECLYFTLECYNEDNESGKTESYNYYKADYKTMRDRLTKIDWKSELHGDFSHGYMQFINLLEQCMDGCIPTYNVKKKKRSMYLTAEAIRMKDLKNKLWKRFKVSHSQYDRSRYIRTKNKLRTLTRSLRVQFEAGIAGDIKTAPKKFWAYVKSRTKVRSKIPTLRKGDGNNAVDAKDKAETLNNVFVSNFTEERMDDIPQPTDASLYTYLDTFSITANMVLEKLRELKHDKSPGPDGWHPFLLKNIADLIHIPLAILFQKSLNEGVVPSQWLDACVTAIHKKGLKVQLKIIDQ